MTVTVKIENTYEDGHESVVEVEVENPEPEDDDLDTWWEDVVFPLTGDGHGAKHPKLGCFYEATVIRADDQRMVGHTRDWG